MVGIVGLVVGSAVGTGVLGEPPPPLEPPPVARPVNETSLDAYPVREAVTVTVELAPPDTPVTVTGRSLPLAVPADALPDVALKE